MQFACLGVAWPPTAGWRKRLIGTFITDEQAERFEAAKFVLASQTIKRHKRQEAELLRVMGREIPPDLLPVETQKSEKAKRKADKRARKAELRRAKEQALHAKLIASKPVQPKPTPKPVPAIYRPKFRIDPNSPEFLSSYEWRRMRMTVLRHHGARCMCCGATPEHGAVMNVDHIKPRRTHPHLALEFDNLQVLCGDCNHGKGNWDTTDWRSAPVDPDAAQFIRAISNDR